MHNTNKPTYSTWNGPVCTTCGACYLRSHKCSPEDIKRRIAELLDLLGCPGCGQHINGAHFCPGPQDAKDYSETCPCNPKNGGSGVCGCILGGPRITY